MGRQYANLEELSSGQFCNLTVTQEGCINSDNPFPWGPQIVPGVVRLLVIK